MKTRNLIGIVGASLIVAACGGGGGGGGGPVGPTTVTVPAWVTLGAPNAAVSSNIDTGSDTATVDITFNANGSITFDLGGGNSVTVTSSEIDTSASTANGELFFFVANDTGTDADFVELLILDDPAEADIVALARIDQIGTPLGYETTAVTGNSTSASNLPTGNAVYTGFMIGSLLFNGELPDFNTDGLLDVQYDFVAAEAQVDVDFGALTDQVDVAFTNFIVPDPVGGPDIALGGSALNGTATIGAGTSIYEGSIAGDVVANGTTYGLAGSLNGGFFGANGEATAGTFNTDETSGGSGTAEFIGNFAAN